MNNDAFKDIFIYVQVLKQIVRIDEGSGDNLTDDDIAQGYGEIEEQEIYVRKIED